MGFSFDNVKHVNVPLSNLAQSGTVVALRADQSCTIKRVTLHSPVAGTATAASYQLENWGTAGTAIKASGGTVVAGVAGTAVTPTPLTATLVTGNTRLAAGEFLMLKYTKAAGDTGAEKLVSVHIEYVDGVGV